MKWHCGLVSWYTIPCDESIFEAYLPYIFAWVVIGFWYFTALACTFYDCFHGITNYEGIDEHISWSYQIGHSYGILKWYKPSKLFSTHVREEAMREETPESLTIVGTGRIRSYHVAPPPSHQIVSPHEDGSEIRHCKTPQLAETSPPGRI
jgi:hypothetical protein